MFANTATIFKPTLSRVAAICTGLFFAIWGINSYRAELAKETDELAKAISETEISAAPTIIEEEFDGIPIPRQETLPKEEIVDNYSTGALVKIQQEIEQLKSEIESTTKDLYVLNQEVDIYEKSIEEKEDSLADKKAMAEYYIRAYYEARNDAALQLGFLSSKTYPDFLYKYSTTEEIMRRINRSVKKDVKDEEELARNRSQVKMKADLYTSTLVELEEKQEKLKEKQKELVAFLLSHREDLAIEQDEAIAKLGNFINRSNYTYDINRSGKFMMLPVEGEVTSPYGGREHPIFGDTRHHAGVDIGVDYGTPIRAAAEGIVIMSGWYGGYGKVVMINHGNDIVSLYGHNDKVLVEKGDVVTKGQVIALAGSTGNSTGPHCHFEVRKNGDDIDPYTYVIRR